MAIDAKELMQAPRFEGYESFVAARPANGDWKASYLFECFGGQVSVEVGNLERAKKWVDGGTLFCLFAAIYLFCQNTGKNFYFFCFFKFLAKIPLKGRLAPLRSIKTYKKLTHPFGTTTVRSVLKNKQLLVQCR